MLPIIDFVVMLEFDDIDGVRQHVIQLTTEERLSTARPRFVVATLAKRISGASDTTGGNFIQTTMTMVAFAGVISTALP